GLSELSIVETMHERKACMERLSDAFVALPGGLGTLDELFEIWTWRQLGIHGKPVGLLNAGGFWSPLVELIDHLVRAGFVSVSDRALLEVAEAPEALIDRLSGALPSVSN